MLIFSLGFASPAIFTHSYDICIPSAPLTPMHSSLPHSYNTGRTTMHYPHVTSTNSMHYASPTCIRTIHAPLTFTMHHLCVPHIIHALHAPSACTMTHPHTPQPICVLQPCTHSHPHLRSFAFVLTRQISSFVCFFLHTLMQPHDMHDSRNHDTLCHPAFSPSTCGQCQCDGN